MSNSQTQTPKSSLRKIQFASKKDFSKKLTKQVEEYFVHNQISKTDSPILYIKTFVLFATLISCWTLLMFVDLSIWGITTATILGGLSIAGIGFNVMHDGGHKSYSKNKKINQIMAYSSDLIGTSSYNWNIKHNQLHHTYVNINHYDDDLNVGILARFSPDQPRLWFHRFQQYYMWFLYCFMKFKWSFFDDFNTLIRGKLGSQTIRRPKGAKLVAFIGGRLFFFSWAIIIPLAYHPVQSVLCVYLCVSAISGLTLACVFSLAHMSEEAAFPKPDEETYRLEDDWMLHQVRTTVNFARKNPLLSWYVGGLNFQIEHHLFPKISHVHYPALSTIVESICKEYDIPYLCHHTLFDGLRSHFRQLKKLGAVD
jgi:linoleoyl-CoA desaturase